MSYGGDFVLIGWSILELTGTSAWVGTAFALYFLPMVLLGILTGGLADRVEFRLADAQELPFEDELFDAVITESVNIITFYYQTSLHRQRPSLMERQKKRLLKS